MEEITDCNSCGKENKNLKDLIVKLTPNNINFFNQNIVDLFTNNALHEGEIKISDLCPMCYLKFNKRLNVKAINQARKAKGE